MKLPGTMRGRNPTRSMFGRRLSKCLLMAMQDLVCACAVLNISQITNWNLNRVYSERCRRWVLSWTRQHIRDVLLYELHITSTLSFYQYICTVQLTVCKAMASLSYLQPHIDAIHAKAVALDVPSPVVDALQDLMHGP